MKKYAAKKFCQISSLTFFSMSPYGEVLLKIPALVNNTTVRVNACSRCEHIFVKADTTVFPLDENMRPIEVEYKPYTCETFPTSLLSECIIRKFDKLKFLVLYIGKEVIVIGNPNYLVTYKSLLLDYTTVDGEPLGLLL